MVERDPSKKREIDDQLKELRESLPTNNGRRTILTRGEDSYDARKRLSRESKNRQLRGAVRMKQEERAREE